MTTTTPRRVQTRWVGWVAFAAVMLLLVGTFNVLTGIAAILQEPVYLSGPQNSFVLDVTGWGWVHLVMGVVMVVTAMGLFAGNLMARSVAVGFLSLNVLSQVMLLPAYPFWSLLAISLDVLAIWAITVHGGELDVA